MGDHPVVRHERHPDEVADEVERGLLARARRGDTRAYSQVVEPYQRIALRSAWLITRDSALAEDAVQEALVNAWRALPSFRDGAPLRPWLLRIVVNEARNHRRSVGRQQQLALRDAALTPGYAQTSDAPESEMLAQEQQRELLTALEQLREEERLVVSYRYLLGLSEQETAEALDIPRGTAKSRLARGLAHLRALLVEAAGEDADMHTQAHVPAARKQRRDDA